MKGSRDDAFLAFASAIGSIDPPLQWEWTPDGPRIDPSDREAYLARIRQQWRDEELDEMYTLMEKYPTEAKSYIED